MLIFADCLSYFKCVLCIAEGIALVRQNSVKRQMAFPTQGI